jgi:hypothetical protein
MVRMHKVYGNLMVDLRATNAKLVQRALALTMHATGADEADAPRPCPARLRPSGQGGHRRAARRLDVASAEPAAARGPRQRARGAGGHRRMTSTPWRWIPSLYFGQGLPYVVVMTLSVVMYKNLGLGNTEIALYTSWLYLPWVIKPLWSPLVDIVRTKRWWIVSAAAAASARRLAMVALTLPMPGFWQLSLALVLADGVQLGHARHRRRRVLHAGPAAACASRLRRRAQPVLPRGDDQPARAGWCSWPGS